MSAWIVAGRRTAAAPRGGAFRRLDLTDLAVPVVQACLADAGISADEVDEVIVANALGGGGNVARLVALASGLPERVAGLTIDRQCAGGLDAVLLARALVESGAAEVVVAGGVESYSRRPLRLRTEPEGGAAVAYDRPAFTPWPDRDPEMHVAAAALAQRLGITRGAQDGWAIHSHFKALRGSFTREIVGLAGVNRDPFARVLTEQTAARAAGLAGSVTTATTAVAADAAAFVVVVSQARAGRAALRIAGGATRGAAPDEPGLAPVVAMTEVLQRAGLTAQDLQTAEIMEAYAVQALACIHAMGIDPAVVNTGGGALARGHPIGASGAILAVRLFHGLAAGHGMAAIAAAGGIGTALLVERQDFVNI
ncbi:MAG: thiolase family protein [Pseudorhodobacter sp.]|nr:thiolase family protein [Pseudorhodobacter sp.]